MFLKGSRQDRKNPSSAEAAPSSGGAEREILRILQITDLHLFADPAGRLLGQNTRETLALVLDLAKAAYWPVDRLVLTGDLVHDESPDGYRYLENCVAQLRTPCNGMPGNHDAANPMSRILGRNAISLESSVRCGKWNLVFLDSTIPGEEGGHLNRTQLEILGSSLAANSKAHTLVCLHHQPVPVGSPWLDTMALDNPEDFFSIVDRSPQVRAIIWGHVHQAFRAERGGVTLLGTPSTCVQFLPGTQGFALDTLTPGFRWLDLHSDGRIESGIRRIAAYPSPMDLTSGGY